MKPVYYTFISTLLFAWTAVVFAPLFGWHMTEETQLPGSISFAGITIAIAILLTKQK